MEAMGLALHSLEPFDKHSWEKYFAVVQTLNEHNWVECHADPALSELLMKDAESWGVFWEMEDAEALVDFNSDRFEDEINSTIAEILYAWGEADAVTAGKAYGHFWDTLMTYPDAE